VVTKRKRRSQLHQASAQRRSERLEARAVRRHRLQVVGTVLVVAAAVIALVAWIVVHDADDGDPAASTSLVVASATVPSTVPSTSIEVVR